MQVNLIRENPDGSADFSFDMSGDEMKALLLYGIMAAIKNGIEEGKKYEPSDYTDAERTWMAVLETSSNQGAQSCQLKQ